MLSDVPGQAFSQISSDYASGHGVWSFLGHNGEHYLHTHLVLYQVLRLRVDQGRIVEAEEMIRQAKVNVAFKAGAEQPITVSTRNYLERYVENAQRLLEEQTQHDPVFVRE